MKVWRDFFFKLSGIGMAIVLAVMLAGILPSQTCHASDGMRFIGVGKTYLLGRSTDQIDLKLHDGFINS